MSLIVDLFAGGGGASQGIKQVFGRDPDIAINHDLVAIAMHEANHPGTIHIHRDIWQVSPMMATLGKPVALLWASPDCKHFSKAKGAAPKRDVEIRSLAWTVERWARAVGPKVIILENVEEFKKWGPIDNEGRPVPELEGTIFDKFVNSLHKLKYEVDYRELRACDYGAPTIRKRLFLIARCDGQPIVWPEPTHGPERIPYRTAAEIIDWSIPCPSIFERKRPLAENTMRRIAEGIRRYVIEAKNPFILNLTHGGRLEPITEPIKTVTGAHRGEKALITPFVKSYYGPKNGRVDFRGKPLTDPLPTQTTENRFALVAPHIQRQFGQGVGSDAREPIGTITAGGLGKTALVSAFIKSYYDGVIGHDLNGPTGTIPTKDHQALVTAYMAQHNGGAVGHGVDEPVSTITNRGTQQQIVTSNLLKLYGTCKAGQTIDEPMPTITSEGQHIGEVRAFLTKYFGNGTNHPLTDPIGTLTTKDRIGLVTVMIGGEPYVITDIGMRMLTPRELFRAQGFSDDYRIDIDVNGKGITKTDQVRCCGNSVCPPVVEALVRANIEPDSIDIDKEIDDLMGEFQLELTAA